MSTGSFSRVGVVGLGTMGAGIAEVLARGGLAVVGIEVNADALDRGRGHLENSTGRAVKRGKLTEEAQQEILGRIHLSTDFADLGACDLVVEAVPEVPELKRKVFAQLDQACRDDAVLATNTSSLSVTEIAATTGRSAQVVGVHFFNPAPVMKLVEVIRTVLTDPEAVRRVAALVEGLGKTPVTIGDRAGFVANRLLLPYLNQAASMLEDGHASRDDIDTAMTVGGGLPMGPFTLMDLIGLDVCLGALEAIHAETGSPRHKPSAVLYELVRAGLLGRKTGRGFYTYDKGKQVPARGTSAAGDAGADAAGVVPALMSRAKDVCFVTDPTRPIIDQAIATGRLADAVGLHQPEAERDLIEIASTVATGDGVAERTADLVSGLGLTPVRCRGRAGFIVDALRFPYLNDAAAMLFAGYADADAIDAAMMLGCGYPTGPIADLDRVGLDRVVSVLDGMHAETGDPSLAPVPLLREHALAGRPLR